jgi:hypothetical protein
MNKEELSVIEILLTAKHYSKTEILVPDDLPPRIRKAFSNKGVIKKPVIINEKIASKATGIESPWNSICDLMFTSKDTFTGELSLTQIDLAEKWFLKHATLDFVLSNPTLSHAFEESDSIDVSYASSNASNRPLEADRFWIDSLLSDYFDEDDKEMLDLVDIKAPEEIETTLEDLVLTTDQITDIGKIKLAIQNRDYLEEIGLTDIGKLLFVGPPGTGKTSTARAIAHSLGLPFLEVKLSMMTSQYLGETSKNIDRTFEVAKRLSPCILFVDEFDSVAKTRRSDEHAALKRAVNTLLKSIDEISLIRDEVLLIGATNHPDLLDSAAWRRFDDVVNFPLPDENMREKIFDVVTRYITIENFDSSVLATMTDGLSGSDIRLVLREAVLEALIVDRKVLTQEDLFDAIKSFEDRIGLRTLSPE